MPIDPLSSRALVSMGSARSRSPCVNDFTYFQAGRLGVMAAYGFLIVIVINIVVIAFLRVLYRQERETRTKVAA